MGGVGSQNFGVGDVGGLSGVDPQNFGPGSVGRKFGSGGVGSVGNCLCYLIILYRKHCVFYRI